MPAQAGLGGGSGNAATTLWAVNELYGRPATLEQLVEWSGALGSDITFFLSGGTAYCTGRGEILTPLPPLPPQRIYLFKPDIGLSTPAVFKALDYEALSPADPEDLLAQFQVCVREGWRAWRIPHWGCAEPMLGLRLKGVAPHPRAPCGLAARDSLLKKWTSAYIRKCQPANSLSPSMAQPPLWGVQTFSVRPKRPANGFVSTRSCLSTASAGILSLETLQPPPPPSPPAKRMFGPHPQFGKCTAQSSGESPSTPQRPPRDSFFGASARRPLALVLHVFRTVRLLTSSTLRSTTATAQWRCMWGPHVVLLLKGNGSVTSVDLRVLPSAWPTLPPPPPPKVRLPSKNKTRPQGPGPLGPKVRPPQWCTQGSNTIGSSIIRGGE